MIILDVLLASAIILRLVPVAFGDYQSASMQWSLTFRRLIRGSAAFIISSALLWPFLLPHGVVTLLGFSCFLIASIPVQRHLMMVFGPSAACDCKGLGRGRTLAEEIRWNGAIALVLGPWTAARLGSQISPTSSVFLILALWIAAWSFGLVLGRRVAAKSLPLVIAAISPAASGTVALLVLNSSCRYCVQLSRHPVVPWGLSQNEVEQARRVMVIDDRMKAASPHSDIARVPRAVLDRLPHHSLFEVDANTADVLRVSEAVGLMEPSHEQRSGDGFVEMRTRS